jgi:hypothetical protein
MVLDRVPVGFAPSRNTAWLEFPLPQQQTPEVLGALQKAEIQNGGNHESSRHQGGVRNRYASSGAYDAYNPIIQ